MAGAILASLSDVGLCMCSLSAAMCKDTRIRWRRSASYGFCGMQADRSTDHTEAWDKIHSADGILVPGGFGIRGVEGMILAAKYAREKEVPYLGICLGMQVGCTTA